MENEKKDTLERIKKPDTMPIYSSDSYDDGDIPPVDLPRNSTNDSSENSTKNSSQNSSQDVIPDEVPRKDGPGGEGGGDQE